MNKKTIAPQTWTTFWNNLGVYKRKRSTQVVHVLELRKKAIRSLRRHEVSQNIIETVVKSFAPYRDPLLFINFSRFFTLNPETVVQWTASNNVSNAFLSLYRIFQRNSIEKLRSRLRELHYLRLFFKKGEGRRYVALEKGNSAIYSFNPNKLTRPLNSSDPVNSSYTVASKFRIDNTIYICIDREAAGRIVHKFVTVTSRLKQLYINLSFDSKVEYAIILSVLRREFKIVIDSAQSEAPLDKLRDFIKHGSSGHFTLTGICSYHDHYRISVYPRYGIMQNVADYSVYQERLLTETNIENSLVHIRIVHHSPAISLPMLIDVKNYDTGMIIGAILFDLIDKGLNASQKKLVYQDFEKDFGIKLKTFIAVDDPEPIIIYEKLLQTSFRRAEELLLRSANAIEIYKLLVKKGLLDWPVVKQKTQRYCTNRDCSKYYKPIYRNKYCPSCKELLLPGREVLLNQVDEKSISEYLHSVFDTWEVPHRQFKRRLLNRTIVLTQVEINDDTLEIIPITRSLNSNQRELMRLRYPGAFVLSSREDLTSLTAQNIECETIAKFVFRVENESKRTILSGFEHLIAQKYRRIRNEANSARARINNMDNYASKEQVTKNLGAHFFEADCSILLKYIFQNSVWLGARTSGSPFPDGLTAIPITGRTNGCFCWDAKYTLTGNVRLGEDKKNKKYIKDGRKNKTIRDNGGLKSMVFISNGNAPKNFVTKYDRFISKNKFGRFKMLFLSCQQLALIFDHFERWETDIHSNQRVQNEFVKFIVELFMLPTLGKKSVVVHDEDIHMMLLLLSEMFNEVKASQVAP